MLLIGVGLARLRPVALVTAGMVLLIAANALVHYPTYYERVGVRDFRQIARELRDAQKTDDMLLIVVGRPTRDFGYFFGRKTDPIGPIRWYSHTASDMSNPGGVMRRLGPARRIVLIERVEGNEAGASRLHAWLAEHGRHVGVERHKKVRIHTYAMNATPG
jgi:hypothetical protein